MSRPELEEWKAMAAREGLSFEEWVRRALRRAARPPEVTLEIVADLERHAREARMLLNSQQMLERPVLRTNQADVDEVERHFQQLAKAQGLNTAGGYGAIVKAPADELKERIKQQNEAWPPIQISQDGMILD